MPSILHIVIQGRLGMPVFLRSVWWVMPFSPIDLIPNPIPVLGNLDDLVLIPLGMRLALKMIPKDVMDEYRGRARATMIQRQPVNWVAASVIVGIWLGLAILTVAIVTKYLNT
jgi:hypothetical protein